jgi:hypothetical protein
MFGGVETTEAMILNALCGLCFRACPNCISIRTAPSSREVTNSENRRRCG